MTVLLLPKYSSSSSTSTDNHTIAAFGRVRHVLSRYIRRHLGFCVSILTILGACLLGFSSFSSVQTVREIGETGGLNSGLNSDSGYMPFLYHTQAVRDFRYTYTKHISHLSSKPPTSNPPPLRLIFRDKSSDQGFGSFFNMLLMSLQYARLEGVGRVVQVDTDSFGYGRLSDFFYPIEVVNGLFGMSVNKDRGGFDGVRYHAEKGYKSFFTSRSNHNSSSPKPAHSTSEQPNYTDLKVDFGLLYLSNTNKTLLFARELNTPPIPVVGMQHLTGHFYSKIYLEMNSKLDQAMSKADILGERRVLAQAVWEPLPFVRGEVDYILKQLHHPNQGNQGNQDNSYGSDIDSDEGKGTFIAVHIRRGDKINLESSNLKPEAYIKKVSELLNVRYDVRTVLLIGDDEGFMDSVRKGVEASSVAMQMPVLKVRKITELFSPSASPSSGSSGASSGTGRLTGKGWHQSSLRNATSLSAHQHTLRLIVSLTVMSKADHVICTHSSNLCRLVQVLRTQPARSLVSLDGDWHQF